MTSAMTSCGDWLNSTPAETETKVEPFGLSLWSQRKTDAKSAITHCVWTTESSACIASQCSTDLAYLTVKRLNTCPTYRRHVRGLRHVGRVYNIFTVYRPASPHYISLKPPSPAHMRHSDVGEISYLLKISVTKLISHHYGKYLPAEH